METNPTILGPVNRRAFLRGAISITGLGLAIVTTPWGLEVLLAKDVESKGFCPVAWFFIREDGRAIILVNKSEMGQGVYTALPTIVAEELEVDLKQVTIRTAPADEAFKDPEFGMQMTGGSTSIRHMYPVLRFAAAQARQMLVEVGAKKLGAEPSVCYAKHGRVFAKGKDHGLSYGELVKDAAKRPLPSNPRIKDPQEFHYIGKPLKRFDTACKVDGKAQFGLDVFLPGILYASIARPPAFGAKLEKLDETRAKTILGVRQVHVLESGVGILADSLDSAWKGSSVLGVQWGKGVQADLDDALVERIFRKALQKNCVEVKHAGNVPKALEGAAKRLEASYFLPYLAHATLEPMNCVAYVQKHKVDVWVPTQNQTMSQAAAAEVAGVSPDNVFIHTTFLGGGFGRRAEVDFVKEAVGLSKASGKPVKLVWTREEDIAYDFFRPGNAARVIGGLDTQGNLVAWSHRMAVPSISSRWNPNDLKDGIDSSAIEGVENTFYSIPNFFVEYVRVDMPIPVGYWRSVGHSHNAFVVESFMDEMAYLAGRDPLEFRLTLLKDNPRARRVLEALGEKAKWHEPAKEGRTKGLALHFSFGSFVGEVAEVSVDKETGIVRVYDVWAVVDCGPYVNPDIIEAQIQGGILMGLSAALFERVRFGGGGVESKNFDTYRLLRMPEAPSIEVQILNTNEPQGGIGEPGVPPIAPAVANGVFRAAGARVRTLPMTPKCLKEALGKA